MSVIKHHTGRVYHMICINRAPGLEPMVWTASMDGTIVVLDTNVCISPFSLLSSSPSSPLSSIPLLTCVNPERDETEGDQDRQAIAGDVPAGGGRQRVVRIPRGRPSHLW